MSIAVAALYRFARLDAAPALVAPLEQACVERGVRGTLLVADEGINGTLAGERPALEAALAEIAKLTDLSGFDVKWSDAASMPFLRMKVKFKREIVTIDDSAASPLGGVGTYVEPEDWNALIADPDVLLIDVRNAYEHRIGSFTGAVDPGTESFREFPAFVRTALADQQHRRVAMFCTGGIRCEKASALMLREGFGEVYHLRGGILRYLERIPATESRWQGACFVFDERVAIGHGLATDPAIGLCHGCRQPLVAEDIAHPDHEAGVACRHCAPGMDETRRAAGRERQRQVELAARRGVAHLGPDAQPNSATVQAERDSR